MQADVHANKDKDLTIFTQDLTNHTAPPLNSLTIICDSNLCLLSYNMHGYNQRVSTLKESIANSDIGVIMVLEHWLIPAN
jgi:hypothetical protein